MMRSALAILLLLFLIPQTMALTLVSTTGKEITIAVVSVEGRDFLVLPEQRMQLGPSDEERLLLVRENFSQSYTHYSRIPAGEVPQTLIVRPAAVVMGTVQNERDDLLVHAPITISCPSDAVTIESDQTGRFMAALPAEQCVISAEAKGRISSIEVTLSPGEVYRTSILVNQTQSRAQSAASPAWVPVIAIAALAAIIALAVVFLRRADLRRMASSGYVGERAKPVLKAKETAIVDYLLARKGRAQLSSMRADLRVPRTSLLRTLESLEQRSIIVKREEHGKLIIELL